MSRTIIKIEFQITRASFLLRVEELTKFLKMERRKITNATF